MSGITADLATLAAAAREAAASKLLPTSARDAIVSAQRVIAGLAVLVERQGDRLAELSAMLDAPCGECAHAAKRVDQIAADLQELREQHRAPCEGCGQVVLDEAGMPMLAEALPVEG